MLGQIIGELTSDEEWRENVTDTQLSKKLIPMIQILII